MTLSGRNACFKAGIILAFLSLAVVFIASFVVIPVYPSMEAEISRRSEGLYQAVISRFLKPDLHAVHGSIGISVLYAFVSLSLILYFFEKTQSPEILFVAFFTLSFSMEAVRLILPLGYLYDIPSLYLLMASRILLFGRYFGIFSLFAASIYSAGFEAQKQRTIILIITVATLVIALGIPIDTQTWDSCLNMINGYTSMFRLIEAGTALITAISFFIAAFSHGSREYVIIGIGSLMAFLGRNLILCADTWAGPLPGILFLALGTWFMCVQLHKIYLWL
jgi:hypothetical protein